MPSRTEPGHAEPNRTKRAQPSGAVMHPRLHQALTRIRAMVTVLDAHPEADAAVVSELRRRVAYSDPLVFGLLYTPAHLTLDGGDISLSDIHAEWISHAGEPGRRIYVAPRGSGKTSWHYLLLPLWMAATGRRRFIAAFSDSGMQSELHLSSFKLELSRNDRLRQDYPDLCAPGKRPTGASVADNQSLLYTKSGFAFAARGADGSSLGIKLGDARPDHLLLDDIEPHASAYSSYQVSKRLATVTDAILPMGSQHASCTLVGTVTLTNSVIHQAVTHHLHPEESRWIDDEGFTVHHAEPFDDAGESIWPERWPTEYLRSIEGTRSFALNFLNQPQNLDGEYWLPTDFVYGALPTASRRILVVDPAVTTARTSDETALAVVSYSAHTRSACVDHVQGVRLKGEPLRELCLRILSQFPDIAYCVWERNQGGEMLPTSVLHDFPVEVRTVHNSEPKPIRIERALSYYRRGVVTHARPFPTAESQMMEFPRGLHDDQADAVSIALDHFAISDTAQRTTLHRAVR
jgi:predicted phage terminase large subunit-like protein